MDTLKEYNERKKADEIVWRSLPTIIGYWFWFLTTIYLWHFKFIKIDLSATIGLGAGVFAWIISKLFFMAIGVNLIHMNLWDNCGCGCLANLIAIPLLPYAGIIALGIWAYRIGSISITETIIGSIVALFDWFLLSYLDTNMYFKAET